MMKEYEPLLSFFATVLLMGAVYVAIVLMGTLQN